MGKAGTVRPFPLGNVQIKPVIAAVRQRLRQRRCGSASGRKGIGLPGHAQQDLTACRTGSLCRLLPLLFIAGGSEAGTLTAGKRTGHQHRRLAAGKVGKRFPGTHHGYGFLPDRMQLSIETAEDYGGLLPCGGALRHKQAAAQPVYQPHLIGHGNVAPVGGHIPEGQRGFAEQPGHGAVSQGPDQHDGQFFTGNGRRRAEGIRLPGDGSMLITGPESRLVPCALRNIGKNLIG